jgi:hypothetical protein
LSDFWKEETVIIVTTKRGAKKKIHFVSRRAKIINEVTKPRE